MLSIMYSILPMFLLILLGVFLKKKFISEPLFWKGSEKIVYYVLFPSLLIHSLAHTNFSINLYTIIVVLSAVTIFITVIYIVLFRFKEFDRSSYTSYLQGSIRYNSYIFIGSSVAIFGDKSLAIVAIIIAYMIVLTNIISVIFLSVYIKTNKLNLYSIVINICKNPLVIACILGVLINRFNITIPIPIDKTMFTLSEAALPISLMCVGAGLHFDHLFNNAKAVISVSIIKLMVFPLITFILFWIVNLKLGLAYEVAILYASVPCAGNAYILAIQMKGDEKMMAAIISVSTLMSIVTIPVIMSIFL